MRKFFLKSLLSILLFFYATFGYSLSNQEVRNAIQDWIKTQEFPQDMDELTLMIDTNITARGILYSYQLKLSQDDLEDFRQVFKSIKSSALDALCNNPTLLWYKNNKVEMTYKYYDEDDNLITIFKIHSSSC